MSRDPGRIRLRELDGLRGWAALSVVTFHIFWECFGSLFPGIRNPLLAGLMNGPFDVSLFFVISGAALSAPFFGGGGQGYVVSAAVKRYVRLTLPIVVFSLIFLVIARAGLVFSHAAAPILHRETWGGLTAPDMPGIGDTILFMLRDVYRDAQGDRNILPFLWTMPIEMAGSMLLFLALALSDGLRTRTFLAAGAMVFLFDPYLGAFFLGAVLCRQRLEGDGGALFGRASPWAVPVALAAIFAFVAFTQAVHVPNIVGKPALVLVAAVLLHLVMHDARLIRFFGGNPVSRFLGRISFMIYIVHYIVIVTVQSWLVLQVRDGLDLGTAMAIGTLALALSVGFAWLALPVDRLSHGCSRLFAGAVIGRLRHGLPTPITAP